MSVSEQVLHPARDAAASPEGLRCVTCGYFCSTPLACRKGKILARKRTKAARPQFTVLKEDEFRSASSSGLTAGRLLEMWPLERHRRERRGSTPPICVIRDWRTKYRGQFGK